MKSLFVVLVLAVSMVGQQKTPPKKKYVIHPTREYSMKEMYADNATPAAKRARARYEARKAGRIRCVPPEVCPKVVKPKKVIVQN